MAPVIGPGTPAPDFELPDQDGELFRLSALRGRTIVLYFYPRADTPGCTTQACSIRDREAEYAAAGVKVVGVSPDPVAKVKRFHDKKDLNFTLLADADHAVAEQYGTWVEKTRDGRMAMGNLRATFVIAPDGTVARVFPEVSPKTHDAVVLAALDQLAAAER